MANCYICGNPHADYRREVQTGTSYRTSYSSKGRSYNSSSVRYGLRNVCAQCAFNIDYNNKRGVGFLLSGFLGGLLIVVGVLCGIIYEYWITYDQGIICIVFGILILILGISFTQIKASKWKKENKEKYIGSYEIVEQDNYLFEKQQILNNILDNFKCEMQNEIYLLDSKAKNFSTEYQGCIVDKVEQIDAIIEDIKIFANWIKLEQEKIENKYSRLMEEITKLEFKNNDRYAQIAIKIKIVVTEIINSLLSQCSENEKRMLQEKVKLLQNKTIEIERSPNSKN